MQHHICSDVESTFEDDHFYQKMCLYTMHELYRLTWVNPKTGRKCANWWTMSKDVATKDKDKIEKEYGCKCELETMKA